MTNKLVTILGCTATGKTRLSVKLADHFNGEIISADSRQVYKYLDIGTGKDLSEYYINNKHIPYHLIDVIDPEEEFDLFNFKSSFQNAFTEIIKRDKLPFLVGGTGLYLSSVLQNYLLYETDFNSSRAKELEGKSYNELKQILLSKNIPLHNITDFENEQRLIRAILIAEVSEKKNKRDNTAISSLVIGVHFDREIIRKRITERLKKRLEEGMIDEVAELLEKGISHERLLQLGLEYKYLSLYLQNKINYNDIFQKLNTSIHRFAKRQMTWFRKMEREGVLINWIEGPDFEKAKNLIESNL